MDEDGSGDNGGLVEACISPDETAWVEVGDDCDDADADVYPGEEGEGARDGVDTDGDGLDVRAFIDQDIEGGAPGDPISGTGCWTCASSCDETLSEALSYSGAGSLYTSDSNNALLFCSADGLSADLAFESWFWDDGRSNIEHRVFFQDEVDTDASPAMFVGFNTVACDPPESYCAQQLDGGLSPSDPVALGSRSEGWHRISPSATYTSADRIDWELCVSGGETGADDEVCASLSSEGYAVGTFHLHHDELATWVDDVRAWSLGDRGPHLTCSVAAPRCR